MVLRPGRSWRARALAASLLLASAPLPAAVRAAEQAPAEDVDAPAEPAREPAPASDMQTATKLFEQARARQRRGDLVGAIALLEDALAVSPEAPEYTKARGTLLYALAGACHQLHDKSGASEPLRDAQRFLGEYAETLDPSDRASRADVERQQAILAAKLQTIAAEEEAAREAEAQRVAEEAARAAQERATLTEARAELSELAEPRTPVVSEPPPPSLEAARMVIAGGLLTGFGAVGLITMGSAMAVGAARDRQTQQITSEPEHDHNLVDELSEEGRRANNIAWVGGIVGGALLVTGASLLAAGVYKRRRELVIAPAVGRASAGLWLSTSF